MNSELVYQIALTLIMDIGPVSGKQFINYFGSAEAIFKARKATLGKMPNIGESRLNVLFSNRNEALHRAEQELLFLEKEKVEAIWYQDVRYPNRLLQCVDAPLLLYHKGNANYNQPKTIGIVGTRRMTDYGKLMCEKLVAELAPYQPLIISGLAFGIDIVAHREALKNGLSTVAVVANGMDRMYPKEHLKTVKDMIKQGSVLTEYCSGSIPDKENFPQRNRIVAGMCDAMIVVETAIKGGAMITANLAIGYNRDVFAFPGDVNRPFSQGCNELIKSTKAQLIESGKDVLQFMNWDDKPKKKNSVQKQLFVVLTPEEEQVVSLLQQYQSLEIDELCLKVSLSHSAVAGALLSLELQGLVQVLPGKRYKLC